MRTREEKIKFLKELSEGKRSTVELMPPIKLKLKETEKEGVYKCEDTGRMYTDEELQNCELPPYSGYEIKDRDGGTWILGIVGDGSRPRVRIVIDKSKDTQRDDW